MELQCIIMFVTKQTLHLSFSEYLERNLIYCIKLNVPKLACDIFTHYVSDLSYDYGAPDCQTIF